MWPEAVLRFLALGSQVLTAAIAILGSSLLLYSFTYNLGHRVARAFSALMACVVVVYLCDTILGLVDARQFAEMWLRVQWVGIAFMPAAYLHLSAALLATTGFEARWSRRLAHADYGVSGVFVVLAVATDAIVTDGVSDIGVAPHLRAGPLFWVFGLYFVATVALGAYNVVRAWRRCLTPTARYRMRYLLFSFLAPAAGAFPYMIIAGTIAQPQGGAGLDALFLTLVLAGNALVAVMLVVMAYGVAYFGVLTPDRVVRARMVKFLVRGTFVSTVTLVAIVVVRRAGPLLGIPADDAVVVVAVGVNLLLQWAIAATKRTLEQGLYLNERDEVAHIQQLEDRLLTSRDLHQFLESVLAGACDALRARSGFIVTITEDRPHVELTVGTLALTAEQLEAHDWYDALPAGGEQGEEAYFTWNPRAAPGSAGAGGYVIMPLYNRAGDTVLGVLGVEMRQVRPAEAPALEAADRAAMARFAGYAASAIEDRLLQQDVFAALEGLMPKLEAIQQRRSAARYQGAQALAAETVNPPPDPELARWVRDALSHYWGGPKLTDSPLLRLNVMQRALAEHEGNPAHALRAVLLEAIERLKPEGQRRMTSGEWILYNILELKFLQGRRARDVAMQLAMSESDLYRKQRVAVEEVARVIANMERATRGQGAPTAQAAVAQSDSQPVAQE